MKRSEWTKTPYAKSMAQNPDAAIHLLLTKYGVSNTQWTTGTGINGRPAVMLRFELEGKGYRMMLETLDAEADRDELLKQIKRALFHYLKSTLEVSTLFFTPEQSLFAFLELPNGVSMYDAAKPHLDKLAGPNFGRLMIGKE